MGDKMSANHLSKLQAVRWYGKPATALRIEEEGCNPDLVNPVWQQRWEE